MARILDTATIHFKIDFTEGRISEKTYAVLQIFLSVGLLESKLCESKPAIKFCNSSKEL